MHKTLWIDVTPIYWQRGRPLDGISRVNHEYAMEFIRRKYEIRFFRCDNQRVFILSQGELAALGLAEPPSQQENAPQPEPYVAGAPLNTRGTYKIKCGVKNVLKKIVSFLPDEMEFHAKHFLRSGWELNKSFFRYIKKIGGAGTTPPSSSQMEPPRADCSESLAEPELPFGNGDVVLIIGLLWTIAPYERLKEEQSRKKYMVITVVHDLIPVFFPEAFSGNAVSQAFDNVVRGSSCICLPSDSAIGDLRKVVAERGLPSPDTCRLRWGDVPIQMVQRKNEVRPERFADLVPGKFVVYVSSMSFRKNHEMVYQLWRHLYMDHKDVLLPLILVGGVYGDFYSAFRTLIHNAPTYPHYLRHESNVSDEDLQWLYNNCRFTIYPSYYEGWGLPVRESLLHGKPCLCSNASSIPEAGDGLVDVLPPFAFYEWREALLEYMTNDSLIEAKTKVIKAEIKPRTWSDSVDDFEAAFLNDDAECVVR